MQAKVLADHLRVEGYEVQLVPINPPFPRGAGWLKRLRYIRTVANEGLYLPTLRKLRSADVVHVASASYWSFLLAPLPAIVAARRWGKPILLNYHSGEADDHLANWGSLVHPWLKMVDKIVVPSIFLRDVFARHGYKAEVIHNVIDTGQFRYRERLPLLPEFLSVRNFEPHYGVEYTLLAFAMIQTVFPAASLTIVGQGPQEPELKHLSQALSVRNVRFMGAVDPAEMPDVYDRHSVFLNSSFVDNQPLSVLEAMASGMPVVTTPIGDIPNMMATANRARWSRPVIPPPWRRRQRCCSNSLSARRSWHSEPRSHSCNTIGPRLGPPGPTPTGGLHPPHRTRRRPDDVRHCRYREKRFA